MSAFLCTRISRVSNSHRRSSHWSTRNHRRGSHCSSRNQMWGSHTPGKIHRRKQRLCVDMAAGTDTDAEMDMPGGNTAVQTRCRR
jgi:hypothetical protein